MTMLTIEKINNFKKNKQLQKKQTEMKRKYYTAPMTMVVVMQHTQMLMVSGPKANRSSYGTANEGVDSKELDSDGNWEWE